MALWSLAVAQPLFDVIGNYPNFLAFRGMDGLDIVVFAVVLALGPPLLLFAAETIVGVAGARPRRALHLAFVAALVGLLAIQAFKKVGVEGTVALIALALAAGIAVAALYEAKPAVRSFLTALSPAPIVVLALFLVASPVNDLVFAKDVGVSAVRVPGNVPVVMMVFDEVSTVALMDAQQRIDAEHFPNLASFARDATWFRHATAPADETVDAVPALVTGSRPALEGPAILSQHPHNLFTFLGGSYRLVVSQEASDLCPRRACYELTRGSLSSRQRALASDTSVVYLHLVAPPAVERDLPSVSQTVGGFAADTGKTDVAGALRAIAGDRPRRFAEFVSALAPGAGRTLYFKHSLLPHIPFRYLPSGRSYTGLNEPIFGIGGKPSWGSDFLLRQAYQRHLLQMQFADFLLGTLLDRLREQDLYDRALIVVTSDGGESFLHRADRNAVTARNVEDIAATPLFIKAPGEQDGRIVDRHVRTLDILPTIAELLHTPLPWKVDGRPAWRSSAGIPQRVEVARRSGKPVVLSFADFKRRLRASVRRKLRLFAAGGEGPGHFGFGPHPELLGRSVRELRVTGGRAGRAKVNDADAFGRVDLESGFLPAYITGDLSGPAAPGRDLAFAVNGRIVGVGSSFELTGSKVEQFAVMVPESAFRDGRNELDVLWVRGGRTSPVLERIGGVHP